MKHANLCLLLIAMVTMTTFAQNIFRQGDAVQTPDGRTGKIESFKNQEMAKVRFGPGSNDTQYFMLTDLKKALGSTKEVFQVGDMVTSPSGPKGKEGRIESINGSTARIRYGPGKYEAYNDFLENLMSPKAAALQRDSEQQELKQKPIRAAFEDESRPFLGTLALTARAYDPKYKEAGGFTINAAVTARVRKDLEGLHAVCEKYPNLTSRPGADPNKIRENPAELCRMAEDPDGMTAKATGVVASQRGEMEIASWIKKMNDTMRLPEGRIKDDVQMLIYDRPQWEKTHMAALNTKYAGMGKATSPEVLAPLNVKADELKAKIDAEAPTRSWKQPPYSDAALEAMVRKAYPGNFPGVKVLKTGMTYTTWKAFDDTSYVGQAGDLRVYRVELDKNRYKNGRALVKLPNQPFCQMRDFSFQQTRTGAAYSAAKIFNLGTSGVFVQCP